MRVRLNCDIPVDSNLTLRAGDEFEVEMKGATYRGPHVWFRLPDGRSMYAGFWQVDIICADNSIVESEGICAGGEDG